MGECATLCRSSRPAHAHRDHASGQTIVKREILRYKRGRCGAPCHFLDFWEGEGYAISNEEDFSKSDEELEKVHQRLDSPYTLAIKGLGQFERFKAASSFRQLIENWHISDFHVSEARGVKDEDDAQHLSATGDNLPSVARYLYEKHKDVFDQVVAKMRAHIPGVDEIEVKVTEDGRLLMRYSDGAFDDPFIDKNVSDGTIKMFSYLVLLHDPRPHPILCVEGPENQLYPRLMAPHDRFVIVRDNDGGDCGALEEKLRGLARDEPVEDVLIRIVVQELESWFLGDFDAIGSGYPTFDVEKFRNRAKYRDPERVANASEELGKLIPGYCKTTGAGRIAA